MKTEMRERLARESYEEKIRKAGQLVRLAREFPRQPLSPAAQRAVAKKEEAIIAAIRHRNVLEFSYNGQRRIVEPQTYGVSTAGHPILRGYQLTGGSVFGYTKGLRLFETAKSRTFVKPANNSPRRAPSTIQTTAPCQKWLSASR